MRIAPNAASPTITPAAPAKTEGTDEADALDFVSALERARAAESTAETASERFVAGDPEVGIHEVMIASEQASIATRFAVTLKNRAIEAYKELLNTPV